VEKAGGVADAALRLLGLARRAGAVEPGTERARNALRSGTAKLVLVAEDASAVQLKKIEGLLLRESVPRAVLGSRAVLGAAVGTGPLSAVAVTERGFAEQLLRRLGDAGPHPKAL
jgi:ribosomal protein L7Ae-like RNA K-turn-binding protein